MTRAVPFGLPFVMKPLFLLTPVLAGLYSWIAAPFDEPQGSTEVILHTSADLVNFGAFHQDDPRSSDSIRLRLEGPRQHVHVTGVRFHGPSSELFSIRSIPIAITHGGETEFKVSFDPDNHPGPVDAMMEIITDCPETPPLRVALKAWIMPAST